MSIFNYKKGFTLIEMVVSIAIFFVVAIVAIGALLKTLDANTKAQNIKTAITNMNFTFETISREMRVGTDYNCETSGADALSASGIHPSVPISVTTQTSCIINTPGASWVVYYNSSRSAIKSSTSERCQLINAYYFDGTNHALWKGSQSTCESEVVFYPLIYNSNQSGNTNRNSDSAINFTKVTVKVVNGNGVWPYAFFRFAGFTGTTESLRNYFDVQTTISQRLPG